MKVMLSLFVLTVLCSYAFCSAAEIKSLTSDTSLSLWKRKDSILPNGASIYSKNGQCTLSVNRATCQIIVKKKSGKILWKSIKTKRRNCYAVLRGNSNFELQSGKIKIWSTNTANKQKGKGPYRLIIDNKCNPIVKNNRGKCAWAMFGCPVAKKKLKAIKKASPRKQFKLIKKLMKKSAKKKKGLVRLPVAKGSKKIKNQVPKVLKKKTPPKPKKKLIIKKSKMKKLKKLMKKKGGKGALKSLKKSLKGKVSKKGLKLLKKLVKKGKSMKAMKKIAMKKLKRKVKKAIKKTKKKDKKAKKVKAKKPKTKKQLVKKIKKLTWMQKIKRAVMRKEKVWKVKRMMKKLGNVKGNVRFWRKMSKMISTRNWNQVARLIALPAHKKKHEFRKPKKWVTKKKYVRYYKKWKTWRWRRTYRGYYQRVCRRILWWTRCRNVYRRRYYNYRYYYWTGAWKYKYVTYRKFE